MKKAIITIGIIVTILVVSPAYANDKKTKDTTPALPTKQELVWEKKYLEERFNALTANITLSQQEISAISVRYQEVERLLKAIEEQEKPKGKGK
ncbi:MAG TPA: hypothetical protein PKI80_03775 [Deltaproteobacteria bacterium]|nr:hypothetical protein [Deltaproteobacteria bacterium]HNS82727.1 hypothetical protein [Methanolinea sp.]